MTAITRAQKRKAKRGRPRLPATNREQNGRKSRREESKSVDQLNTIASIPAVQRRIRDNRLVTYRDKEGKQVSPEQQAMDPRRGYALGLLLIDATITQAQHDAGVRYGADIARYHALTGIPFPSARAQNLFAVRGSDGDDSESKAESARRARATAKLLDAILLAVGDIDTGRRVSHTVKQVCVLDIQESRCWPEHMIVWLRKGLNALISHYQIQ